ncbi:MAG: hypothetical protein AB1861_19655 [Cyanobacteriota bacterium]
MTLETPTIHKKRTAEDEHARSVKARSPRHLFLTPKESSNEYGSDRFLCWFYLANF